MCVLTCVCVSAYTYTTSTLWSSIVFSAPNAILNELFEIFYCDAGSYKICSVFSEMRKKGESRFQSFESYQSMRRNNILSRVNVFDAGLFGIDSIFYTCSKLASIGYFIHSRISKYCILIWNAKFCGLLMKNLVRKIHFESHRQCELNFDRAVNQTRYFIEIFEQMVVYFWLVPTD